MSKIAVIDADTILYAVALNSEQSLGDNEPPLQMLTQEQANKEVSNRLEAIADALNADNAIVCLTDARNWRNAIYPQYKKNRKDKPKPNMLAPLRAAVLAGDATSFPTLKIKWLEADDVVGISAGVLERGGKKEPIIVSIDKDLWTVPGVHWNPSPTKNGKVRPIETVSERMADRMHMLQTMTGDVVDGYPGCPGVGKVKANTLLDEAWDKEYSAAHLWSEIEQMYITRGFTAEDALVQARVSRICRVDDWDTTSRRVRLWQPPKE